MATHLLGLPRLMPEPGMSKKGRPMPQKKAQLLLGTIPEGSSSDALHVASRT